MTSRTRFTLGWAGEFTQALPLLRRSIDLLKTNGLPQDSAGTTLAQHEALLAELEARG